MKNKYFCLKNYNMWNLNKFFIYAFFIRYLKICTYPEFNKHMWNMSEAWFKLWNDIVNILSFKFGKEI